MIVTFEGIWEHGAKKCGK